MKSMLQVNEEKKLQVTNKHEVKSITSINLQSQLMITWITSVVLHL